jgi:transcription initiation factor TFIID TATA-box-binding protein
MATDDIKEVSEGLELTDADEGLLEKYRAVKKASPILIKNCVATAFFGAPLDLEEISWKKHGEFNPLSFAASKFRLKTPSTTALMFASGKIVCTGAPSEESAHEAILKYYRMVQSVVPEACCLDFVIENIVGRARG